MGALSLSLDVPIALALGRALQHGLGLHGALEVCRASRLARAVARMTQLNTNTNTHVHNVIILYTVMKYTRTHDHSQATDETTVVWCRAPRELSV